MGLNTWLVPWNEVGKGESPFVSVFNAIHIPYVDHLMNFVILTAALSSMNSGMYSVSRMLYSLSKEGYAPKSLGKLSKSKIPANALLVSTLFTWIGIGISYWSPDKVFSLLASIPGFTFLFVWALISLSHIYYRKKILATDPEKLKFKMWGYPWTSWIAIVALGILIVSIAFTPGQEIGVLTGLGAIVFFILMYMFFGKKRLNKSQPTPYDKLAK